METNMNKYEMETFIYSWKPLFIAGTPMYSWKPPNGTNMNKSEIRKPGARTYSMG